MTQTSTFVRYALGLLLAFGALNAFAGGYYGLSGAPGVPVEWLAGSPFQDYFVPSVILFVVVGGTLGFAALAVLAGSRVARRSAFIAGATFERGSQRVQPGGHQRADTGCPHQRHQLASH